MDEDTKTLKLFWQLFVLSNKSLYSCKLCKYETNYSQDIKRHSIIHTQTIDERKKFKCDKCGSKYRDKRDLKVHEGLCFQCTICKTELSSEEDLNQHVQ